MQPTLSVRSTIVASPPQPAAVPRKLSIRRLGLIPLIAATYFMVSGGPYGIEDIVGQAGYKRALLLLCIVPLLWSLPTALMIGELAGALPEEGGFYIWVTRALGRFWGWQEAWLSLAASIFDMAIYPALTVAYLAQLNPAIASGHRGLLLSLAIVALCVAWNLRGAYSVGQGSLWMLALLLTPFLGIVACGLFQMLHHHASHSISHPQAIHGSMVTAFLFVLWNYMGWDNASTIAQEVQNPQKNYLPAMLGAVLLVTLSYVVPVAIVAYSGIPAFTFVTGSWAAAAHTLATPLGSRLASSLAFVVVVGGALTGIAMFNALTLSYARVPAAMASDGMLPRVLARRMNNGVPWVAVLACACGWALALGLNLTRLLELDILLYGLSLLLEFIALVVLRVREPHLARPFRIPGGLGVAIALGIPPTLLVGFTLWAARADRFADSLTGRLAPHISALAFGLAIALAGPIFYFLAKPHSPRANFPQHNTSNKN